jgi:asparagine synthase (glutamine-hydrolysing)
LIDRGKAGFAPPVGDWIKGPLRPWAEDLLPTSGEFFDTEVVRRRWRDHLSGKRDYSEALWGILTFQAWLRSQSNVSANAA